MQLYDTVHLLVDTRDLTKVEEVEPTLAHWPAVAARWSSRLRHVGPGDEQVDLVFVRAAKGTGLHLVHPTWACEVTQMQLTIGKFETSLRQKFARNALLRNLRSSPKMSTNTSSNFSCKAVTKHPSLSFLLHTPQQTKAVLRCFCLCRLLFTASPPCLRRNKKRVKFTCEIAQKQRTSVINITKHIVTLQAITCSQNMKNEFSHQNLQTNSKAIQIYTWLSGNVAPRPNMHV